MIIDGRDLKYLSLEVEDIVGWAEKALEVLIDNQWGNGAEDDGEIAMIKCPCCCNTPEQGHSSMCDIGNLLRRAGG